jgi:hypothetical protein
MKKLKYMNKERLNKLLELYEGGFTTSEEEKELLTHFNNSRFDNDPWFEFLAKEKKSTPDELEDEIWSHIVKEKRKKRTLFYGTGSIAASILLVVALFVTNPFSSKQMNEEDKLAALQEAYAMLDEVGINSSEKEIIYEDDILVLYTE